MRKFKNVLLSKCTRTIQKIVIFRCPSEAKANKKTSIYKYKYQLTTYDLLTYDFLTP